METAGSIHESGTVPSRLRGNVREVDKIIRKKSISDFVRVGGVGRPPFEEPRGTSRNGEEIWIR